MGRDVEAEYFYEHGLHEFGPSFATKYVVRGLNIMSSEWAQELARKKRQEIEGKKAEAQQVSSDRKLVEGGAERLWADLRQQLESHVKDLNAEWGEARLTVTFPDGNRADVGIVGGDKNPLLP